MATLPPTHFFYHISVDPTSHYYNVNLTVEIPDEIIFLRFPCWTPGSYVLRDFVTNIFNITAYLENTQKVSFEQVDLTTWKVINHTKKFYFSYQVYAFENTVHTNFLDTEFGFIRPAGFFFYVEEYRHFPIYIKFSLNKNFKYIYSPLPAKKGIYKAQNFDELYDSPFLLSNQKSQKFQIQNCTHELVIEGDISTKTSKQLVEDLKTLTQYQLEAMQSSPNKYYLFILNLTTNKRGGLEHRACSVNFFDGKSLSQLEEYKELLGLLSHEYFHLWNVKRIRPIALDHIDYQKPLLIKELWIAEGFTSFYDSYFLLKCRLYSKDEYLQDILKTISRLEDYEGEKYMSLEEASFTAWTKYYKQNPHSPNISISYYTKGAILALCMNIAILDKTNAKKELLDVLYYLYKNYFQNQNRGFSKQEFFEAIYQSTKVDLYEEFESYISQRIKIPVQEYLKKIGVNLNKSEKFTCLHFETRTENKKEIVSKIYSHHLKDIDISLEDEILAINDCRVEKATMSKLAITIPEHSEIKILLSRRGKIKTVVYPADYTYKLGYELDEEFIEKNPVAKKFFE